MAIVDAKGGIHGKAGSVIYRSYRGINIIQGIPKAFRQTRASKESASEFGMSSSCGRVIREAFRPLYRDQHDGALINRLSSMIYRCIRASKIKGRGERDLHDGDLSLLEGMEFNQNSPFSQVLRVKPEVTRDGKGRVVVRLPRITAASDLALPTKWIEPARYKLSFMLAGFNFRENFFEYIGAKELDVEKTTVIGRQDLIFEGEVPQGCILLLMASITQLSYNLYDGSYENRNSREFCPAALIAAFQSDGNAPTGYGRRRLSADSTLAKQQGTPPKTLPITGYYGLDPSRLFKEPKKMETDQLLIQTKAAPPVLAALKGKRVKF